MVEISQKTRRSIKVYTGLPVVRVTQKQKALNWVVLNCRVPVNFFKWGVIKTMSRQQRPFGSHVYTFNYFLISCPILRSFSFLSFGNKFSLKITNTLLSKGARDHLVSTE